MNVLFLNLWDIEIIAIISTFSCPFQLYHKEFKYLEIELTENTKALKLLKLQKASSEPECLCSLNIHFKEKNVKKRFMLWER